MSRVSPSAGRPAPSATNRRGSPLEQFFSHGELVLATFAYCVGSGFVPLMNAEAYLIAVSAASAPVVLVPLILAATAGQMVAKSLMYLAGRGILKIPLGRYRGHLDTAGRKLSESRLGAAPFVGLSGLVGLPPFYLTSILAGALRLHFFWVFLAPGTGGRMVRFGLVALFPQVIKSLLS